MSQYFIFDEEKEDGKSYVMDKGRVYYSLNDRDIKSLRRALIEKIRHGKGEIYKLVEIQDLMVIDNGKDNEL